MKSDSAVTSVPGEHDPLQQREQLTGNPSKDRALRENSALVRTLGLSQHALQRLHGTRL